jgi:hypothetical protein
VGENGKGIETQMNTNEGTIEVGQTMLQFTRLTPFLEVLMLAVTPETPKGTMYERPGVLH